jgi:hypothetical protein
MEGMGKKGEGWLVGVSGADPAGAWWDRKIKWVKKGNGYFWDAPSGFRVFLVCPLGL